MNHGRKFQSEAVYLHPFLCNYRLHDIQLTFIIKSWQVTWLCVDCTFSHDFRNVCYPGLLLLLFFLIIKKWKSERPNKILRPNLGFGGSKIGMSCQNRDTWQIWARIPVIIISILVNIVLSDFYIGLAQFRRPYVPFFRSFSYKNAGFKSKKK